MASAERRIYEPRAYGTMAVQHLLDNQRCALWAGMGLGKTVLVYTALDILRLEGETDPALVLGPLRVARRTWPKEALKWAHLKNTGVIPIVGTEAERRAALRLGANVFTINYENLPWLVEHYGDKWPFKTVVSDESTRLKGFRLRQGTARSKALGRVAHTKIKRFIELTGAPAPNGLQDLWGPAWFLDAGQRLGRTHDAFKQRWFQRSHTGYGLEPLPMAQIEIQSRLRDLCMTIDAADYFDLAKPLVNNIYVDLPAKARIKYDEMESEMFTIIAEREVEAFGAAARTQKCLQLANGAVYVNPLVEGDQDPRAKEWRELHTVKLDALESVVEELAGEPLIVSYEFKSDVARIQQVFPKAVNLSTEHGYDKFLTGNVKVGLAHPQSLGHGVDELQDVCSNIAHFGHNWNLDLYDQINARIGPVRQMQSGRNKVVTHHHIIARDTVDELVMARRENKRAVQDILLEAMKRRG